MYVESVRGISVSWSSQYCIALINLRLRPNIISYQYVRSYHQGAKVCKKMSPGLQYLLEPFYHFSKSIGSLVQRSNYNSARITKEWPTWKPYTRRLSHLSVNNFVSVTALSKSYLARPRTISGKIVHFSNAGACRKRSTRTGTSFSASR